MAVFSIGVIKKTRNRGLTILLICVIGITLYYSHVGFKLGRYALFQTRKSTYVQQLADAQRLGHVQKDLGITEDRLAELHGFYWQRGMLDNFSLAVFDPSGKIAEINDCDGWDAIHSHELSKLFGGTFYRCQDVGGGWYICWFT